MKHICNREKQNFPTKTRSIDTYVSYGFKHYQKAFWG